MTAKKKTRRPTKRSSDSRAKRQPLPRFQDLSLSERMAVGVTEAEALSRNLKRATHAYDFVKDAFDATLRAGATEIDDDTRKMFREFEDRLSDLAFKAKWKIIPLLKGAFVSPLEPRRFASTKIDRDTDRDVVRAKLLELVHAVAESEDAIYKASSGSDREYYISVFGGMTKLLHQALNPPEGEPN